VEIATREHDDEVLEGLHGEGDDQPLSTEEVEAIYEATLKINEKAVGNVFTAFNQQQAKEQMRPDDDIQEELRARDQADGHRPGTYFATSVGGESTLGTALDNPKSIGASSGFDLPDGNDILSVNPPASAQPLGWQFNMPSFTGRGSSFLASSEGEDNAEDFEREVSPTPTSRPAQGSQTQSGSGTGVGNDLLIEEMDFDQLNAFMAENAVDPWISGG